MYRPGNDKRRGGQVIIDDTCVGSERGHPYCPAEGFTGCLPHLLMEQGDGQGPPED